MTQNAVRLADSFDIIFDNVLHTCTKVESAKMSGAQCF